MNGLQWAHPILSKISFPAAQFLVENHRIIVLDAERMEDEHLYIEEKNWFYLVLQGRVKATKVTGIRLKDPPGREFKTKDAFGGGSVKPKFAGGNNRPAGGGPSAQAPPNADDKEDKKQEEAPAEPRERIQSCLKVSLPKGCPEVYLLAFREADHPRTTQTMHAMEYRKDSLTFDSAV